MNNVDICNLALNMLNMPAITSLDEDSPSARICRRFFPVCCQRVLRDHFWSFAVSTADLAVIDETSFDPAFPHVCTIPGDCIRIIGLADKTPYRKAGNKILTRNPHAQLIYIRNVENAVEFDVTFGEALQYHLAAELALGQTRDANLANFYRSEYRERLAIARSIDSAENIAAYQPGRKKSNVLAGRFSDSAVPGLGTPVEFIKGTHGIQRENQ